MTVTPPPRRLTASALLLLVLGGTRAAAAQADTASVVDSLTHWYPLGLHALPSEDGDSVLTDAYLSYLPPGDTVWTRRWALHGGGWLLAQARHRGLRRAAVVFLWPSRVTEDAPPGRRPATWSMLFARDSLGCWFIVNDTTPLATCPARDGGR